MTHATPSGLGQRFRFRLYGLAFLLVVALALALTVALYQKTFKDVVSVKVATDRAGLQLLSRSDVKIRGLIIGEVRDIRATSDGAEIDLAIDSDKAKLVPSNSQARLLPKTLFGEKYVDLLIPAQPASAIRAGQTIQQDRTQAAIEVDKVLNDVLPVLQAVQPEKLNATLNALATALQGRGDQLGRNLELADDLLKKINPKLPTLMYDIRALSDVSDIYDQAAPDLLRTLRNLNVTSQTIVEKKTEIEALIPAVTAVSDKSSRFVGDNASKIVGVNIAGRPGLELAATYSPSLPCVFKGLMRFKPRLEAAVGGRNKMLNLTVEIVKPRPAYSKIDLPEAKDYRKPRCYGLPYPKVPFPDYVALDGTEDDLWWKNAKTSGVPNTDPIATTPGSRGRSMSGIFMQPGSDMTDQDMIKNVVAPLLRVPADQVPDAAALVFGPVMHGGVVTIK